MDRNSEKKLFKNGPEENESVVAILVTYNRKDLLFDCLKALSRQSRPLDGLVIVDNASTDGTHELLYHHNILDQIPEKNSFEIQDFLSFPPLFGGIPVITLRINENIGGAGGFHEGIKKAFFEGADWMWLMDDDIDPDPQCLKGMLSFSDISKCLHPRKYFMNGATLDWEGYFDLRTGRRFFQNDPSFKKGFSFCTINTGCFEGMLIHRKIIDLIGLPDKRFFLGMDDSLYGFLAHHHTPVLYLRDPFVNKRVYLADWYEVMSDRNIYYGMRNSFLLFEAFNKFDPDHRSIRAFFLGLKFIEKAFHIFKYRKKKFSAYKFLIKGFWDGLIGRFGKGF